MGARSRSTYVRPASITSGHYSCGTRAERLGYAALWARGASGLSTEDVRFPRSDTSRPLDEYYIETFEPIETLAFVAAQTERIKLGTSVLSTPVPLATQSGTALCYSRSTQ